MIDSDRYIIHQNKDGRLIAYDRMTQKNKSYPRIIMEDYLKRELSEKEEVHHKDGNYLNNEISNLIVLTRAEHLKVHNSLHYHNKYFDINMICPQCKREFLWTAKQQHTFMSNKHESEKKGKTKYGPFCSKECSGLYATLIQYGRL